ncbi:mutase [Chania multitudinisentens RB-25]|uniref:Mutase n=1 Tax=Chania multitudinisentens RB-25 TaxID=1441930 RepID=W0LB44_9GAMM|nr:phosphopentomutase [Chania multitudinisentens]AHG20921.1 mutase [Chania multitudinisentens RB-25]
MSKFIVIVIDSFGVGAMPDVAEVRPQDIGANTCQHLLQSQPELRLATLEKLGLINALGFSANVMQANPQAVAGRALLQHEGGDTFMGHQEIMGTLPLPPLRMPFSAVIDRVEQALLAEKHQVERIAIGSLSYLWVDGAAAIGDNLEADLGQVYNISANLAVLTFEQVQAIGHIVRRCVKVGRVIAFGGLLENTQAIQAAAETRQQTYIGINAPKSGAYNRGFQVVHLGYGVDQSVQVPEQLHQVNIPTVLIGKVADIVANPHGISYEKLVDSQQIMDLTLQHVRQPGSAFICSNIQETDLAGHAQNPERYIDCLKLVDRNLASIIDSMSAEDCLVVMADHGNDPTIGHSKHTREQVPILVYQQGVKSIALGTRQTLADVGASVCEFFTAPAPQHGQSFLSLLRPR